jgi:tetratricopeptide (TPR) repeat protein
MIGNANSNPEWQHGKGLALLLLGHTASAMPQLAGAAHVLDSADAWNDYGAALLADAEEQSTLTPVVDSFIATEAALQRNPHHPASLLNRALALEQLGLLHDALAAWRSLLQQAPDLQYESLRNIKRLEGAIDRNADWPSHVPTLRYAVKTNDQPVIRHIVNTFRGDARTWGEGMFTSLWASNLQSQDLNDAEANLAVARAIGAGLCELSGERLLVDAVSVIDHAKMNNRRILANAYLAYRDGRIAHQNDMPVDAGRLLQQSIDGFEQVGSPMEFVARYYLASALFSQSRTADAFELLESLAALRFERRGYLALAAQIGWERGLCYLVRGSYSSALDIFESSRALFVHLDEPLMAASFDEFTAATFDFMGDEEHAWSSRKAALEVYARAGDHSRIITALETATRSMLMRGDFRRMRPVLVLVLDHASKLNDPVRTAEALLQRSVAQTGLGNPNEARQDAAAAFRWISHIKDPGARRTLEVDLSYAQAMAISSQEPAHAATLLTEALLEARNSERSVYSAQLLLERGRLARRMHDRSAEADFAKGLDLMERQRVSTSDLNQRAMILHTTAELFQSAIDVAIETHDNDAAFVLTERSRARSLLDGLSERSGTSASVLSRSQVAAALTPDSAIVEYVTANTILHAFVITSHSFQLIPLPPGEGWQSLVEPVLPILTGIRQLAIVPDRHLQDVYFAELSGPAGTRRLIDDFALTMAPSASVAITCSRHPPLAIKPSVLVIAASAFDQQRYPTLSTLTYTTREAKAVAAAYSNVLVLSGSAATPVRVREEMRRSAIIHYAGHALARPRRPLDSILLLASDGEQELSASSIARLDLRHTNLVFLSACRSGITGDKNDGVQSLATAFLIAGVPAVVATTADIDDESAVRFAERFHTEYRLSGDASRAFQSAIRSAPEILRSMILIGGSKSLVH